VEREKEIVHNFFLPPGSKPSQMRDDSHLCVCVLRKKHEDAMFAGHFGWVTPS